MEHFSTFSLLAQLAEKDWQRGSKESFLKRNLLHNAPLFNEWIRQIKGKEKWERRYQLQCPLDLSEPIDDFFSSCGNVRGSFYALN